MALVELRQVTKAFGKNTVIENMDLQIEDGKFTVLVGPSGCGKTTLLRMIAGIGPQTSGKVKIGERDVSQVPPGGRGVAMVFQNYAIYPTMSVWENIEFGLKNNKVPREERKRLVEEVAAKAGLEGLLDRRPGTLSGGQRQRVALARAMVKKPQVFLMDEPLSNLDAKLRVQMRVELIELHQKLKTTFIYVTHDQTEAMSMGDTIILMNNGRIQQMASPSEIYKDPENLFTACFIGSPAMNIWKLPDGRSLGFRPEHVKLLREKKEEGICLAGCVATREMLGAETIHKVAAEGGRECMVKLAEDDFFVGDSLYLHVPEERLYLFDSDGSRIREGGGAFAQFGRKIKEGAWR